MKHVIFLILASAVGVIGVAQAYDQNTGYCTAHYCDTKCTIPDPELAKRIESKIGPGWFSKGYDQVQVQVNNGLVTLQGSVSSAKDFQKVEKQVRAVRGVQGINNLIAIEEGQNYAEVPHDHAVTARDYILNQKIRDSISHEHLTKNDKSFSLNTNHGIVVLEGVVETPKEQQKIISQIHKIDGVRDIRSTANFRNSPFLKR